MDRTRQPQQPQRQQAAQPQVQRGQPARGQQQPPSQHAGPIYIPAKQKQTPWPLIIAGGVFVVALAFFAVNRMGAPKQSAAPLLSQKTPPPPPSQAMVEFRRQADEAKKREEEERRKAEEAKVEEPIATEPVAANALKNSCTYELPRAVEMAEGFGGSEEAKSSGFMLQAGMVIKIFAAKRKGDVVWYQVRATDPESEETVTGWIDSSKLEGVKLTQVKEAPKAPKKRVVTKGLKTKEGEKTEEKKTGKTEDKKEPVHVWEVKDAPE